MNTLLRWLFKILLHDLAAYCGYVPAPKAAQPNISAEKVVSEPERIVMGGNPSSPNKPQAQQNHGPI